MTTAATGRRFPSEIPTGWALSPREPWLFQHESGWRLRLDGDEWIASIYVEGLRSWEDAETTFPMLAAAVDSVERWEGCDGLWLREVAE